MSISTYHGASLKLPALFVILTAVPLAGLGWLGWRLLEQDRALENQRVRERLENAAGLLARELDRGLATWEDLLPAIAQGASVTLPPDVVALLFDSGGVRSDRGVRLPYYPLVPESPETPGGVFAAAEVQEFRDGNLAMAADAYRRLQRIYVPSSAGTSDVGFRQGRRRILAGVAAAGNRQDDVSR